MKKFKVWFRGFRDGFDSPSCLSCGMSYEDANLNEIYDRGVNFGQIIGGILKRVSIEGYENKV